MPLKYEAKHLGVVSEIRQSNYDVHVMESLQDEHIVIQKETPYVYKVLSSNEVRIPFVNYRKEKESVSYLYAGDIQ